MPSTIEEWNRTLPERTEEIYGSRYMLMYHLEQPIGHIKELPVHELRWYLRKHRQTLEEIKAAQSKESDSGGSINPKSPLGKAVNRAIGKNRR